VAFHHHCEHANRMRSSRFQDFKLHIRFHIYGKFLGVLFTGIIIKGQAQQWHFIQITMLSSFIVRLTLAYKTVKKKSSSKVHCLETKTENYLLIRVLFRCVIKQMKNIFTSIMYITVEISKFQIEQVVNIYRKGYPKSNSNAKCSDNKDSAHKILGLWFFFILLPS